jgi:hypothetical protein
MKNKGKKIKVKRVNTPLHYYNNKRDDYWDKRANDWLKKHDKVRKYG